VLTNILNVKYFIIILTVVLFNVIFLDKDYKKILKRVQKRHLGSVNLI